MSVLILGASGTGKEYVARSIHRQSLRKDKPFYAIDCGAIPKEVAASEFFGYKKGAFTGAEQDKKGAFEIANGGTVFLDEMGKPQLRSTGAAPQSLAGEENPSAGQHAGD